MVPLLHLVNIDRLVLKIESSRRASELVQLFDGLLAELLSRFVRRSDCLASIFLQVRPVSLSLGGDETNLVERTGLRPVV